MLFIQRITENINGVEDIFFSRITMDKGETFDPKQDHHVD